MLEIFKYPLIASFTTHLVIPSGAQRSRGIYASTACIADIRCEDPSTLLRLGRDDSVCDNLKESNKFQGTSKNELLNGCPEILAQIEVWKTQEYWMYFKFFKLNSWDKRSGTPAKRRF